MAAGKNRRQWWKEQSSAVQLWWKQSQPAELFLSEETRGTEEKKRDLGGRGEEKGCLALPSGLHCGKGGLGGGGNVCGARKEEIQLNYMSTECIFNHAASFPDLTVSLCVRLWGILWKRSCHIALSVRPSQLMQSCNTIHSSLGRSWNDVMKKKIQSTNTNHVTLLLGACIHCENVTAQD